MFGSHCLAVYKEYVILIKINCLPININLFNLNFKPLIYYIIFLIYLRIFYVHKGLICSSGIGYQLVRNRAFCKRFGL